MASSATQLEGFDFLAKSIDDDLLRASAQNILDSYAHPWDILSESLQNSVDAVELNCQKSPKAIRQIRIIFDCQTRSVEISDTGVGISAVELEQILVPHKSFKRGIANNLRGEKGVGMSFMVFTCNRFRIETCDGTETVSLEVRGTNSWVRGLSSDQPRFSNVKVSSPQVFLNSMTYTRVWMEDVAQRDTNEEDIFQYTKERLIYVLRSKTAVGHTHSLFHGGQRPPVDIKVELQYVDEAGLHHSFEDVEYSYASPAEYLPKADVITWERYQALLMRGKAQKLGGKSLVDSGVYTSDTGKEVRWFAFAASRKLYDSICETYKLKTERSNDIEPGIYVSTKGMPSGIQLTPPRSAQASYWPSFFILIEYDAIRWDLGRKYVPGRVAEMMKRVALTAVFNKLVDHISQFITGSVPEIQGLESEKELDEIKAEVREAEDLKFDRIAYLKEPKEEQGVLSIFHELVGAGILKGYHVLRSSVREQYDAYVRYTVSRSMLKGKAREKVKKDAEYEFFVEFKYDASKLLPDLETRKRARDMRLLVCWKIDESKYEQENVDVDMLEPDESVFHGATHRLIFSNRYKFGAENQLEVICLKTLFDRLRNGQE